MQQVVRAALGALRSSIASHPHCSNGLSRVFSSQSAALSASANYLDKEEVTTRVVDLLKSVSFVDPTRVTPTAKFKEDLQLDTLENVEVMLVVEEEFAVDIPDTEANKFSTTAHIIDYLAAHPQAK